MEQNQGKNGKKAGREARLAKALRENLKKRKAQQDARAQTAQQAGTEKD